jgi:hypothetical protein
MPNSIIGAMLGSKFVICYDTGQGRTSIIAEAGAITRLVSAVPGMRATPASNSTIMNAPVCLVASPVKNGEDEYETLSDMHAVLSGSGARVCMGFSPADKGMMRRLKRSLETELSGIETKRSSSLSKGASGAYSGSAHTESYQMSDERKAMFSILEMLDEIALRNFSAYGISIVIESESAVARDYFKSKMLVIDEEKVAAADTIGIYGMLGSTCMRGFPIANSAAGFMMAVPSAPRMQQVKSDSPARECSDPIRIGRFLKDSLAESGLPVALCADSMGLGCVITGLPGTGKTSTAMSIVGSVISSHRGSAAAIISPTNEWADFGIRNGMRVIRIYRDTVPMNFFKCSPGINPERFYENLAMLIASASNAGPYRNSMEKCLLSAFRKAHAGGHSTDPTSIYYAIEDSIIEMHGRRTNAGVRYTKHGENIHAALENLRLMLSRPEFSAAEGVGMGELFGRGVVFDLSAVSNSMKQFYYALILNQVYGFVDSLDEKGDGMVRMLVCLEEAQLAVPNDERSAVVLDMRQRIQDFRKKGVALMLMAHSITDIDLNARRMCQAKIYFRQGSDVAKQAVLDLGFAEEELPNAANRMKRLEQRTCVVTHVKTAGAYKAVEGPMFVKTDDLQEQDTHAGFPNQGLLADATDAINEKCNMRMNLLEGSAGIAEDTKASVSYLGEKVWSGTVPAKGHVVIEGLLKGRMYSITFGSGQKRMTKRIKCMDVVSIDPNS